MQFNNQNVPFIWKTAELFVFYFLHLKKKSHLIIMCCFNIDFHLIMGQIQELVES